MENNRKLSQRKINWTNTLFLTITPLVGILGTGFFVFQHSIHWATWLLALLFAFATGLSITCGYHRLFSHKAYSAHWLVRLFFACFGSAAFEGSAFEWSSDHRNHHRYTDTDQDPYNAKRGFWYSHIGWLIFLDVDKRDFSNIEDLKKDPILRFQHKFFVPLAIVFGFVLPMLIASLWGNALQGLIIAGAVRITLNHHFTFFINSVCHIFGKRTYSDHNTARDNWFTALFTYGEGYHNFHHKFPIDYRNGIRFYDFDPSKWLIAGLYRVGLAKNLKRISQHRIIECKIAMDEKYLRDKVGKTQALSTVFSPLLDQAKQTILQALQKLDALEKGYKEMKKNRGLGSWDDYKKFVKNYRAKIKQVRKELRYSLRIWTLVVAKSKRMALPSN